MRGFNRNDIEAPEDIIQNITKITYARLKVTICLYLSPNNRARSLSRLIAVAVSKDTEHNVLLAKTLEI